MYSFENKVDISNTLKASTTAKQVSNYSHRRLVRENNSSISPQMKPHHPASISESRPKSQLNLLRATHLPSHQCLRLKKSRLISGSKNASGLISRPTLNQNSESLTIERKQLHEAILYKIDNLKATKTLLDYNYETAEDNSEYNMLSSLLLLLKNGCRYCGSYCKSDKSKTIDLTAFNTKAMCIKCNNLFLVESAFEGFICEECNTGNTLQKYNGDLVQINLCGGQILAKKNPSQELFNLFTDRSQNLSPNKIRIKRVEESQNDRISLLNIVLPSRNLPLYSSECKPYAEYIKKISQIREKGKLISRDTLTLIQEQKEFDVKDREGIERTIGEYAKRLRIVLKEINEFVPEYSQALEIIFKANVSGIDSLVTSCNNRINDIQEEYVNLQGKLCDQEILKTEIRRIKVEFSQKNKKYNEEVEYLKALVDRYKFTVELYRKELDNKEILLVTQD